MIQLADRDTWICRVCSGKKVLHLGCVDAPLLEEKARTGDCCTTNYLKWQVAWSGLI